MSETATMATAHNWAFAVYIVVALVLCSLLLVLSRYLGGRSKGRSQHIPYESGLDSVGSARQRFSLKFYLIAMFFVIFDVEALYLFAWSVSVREVGWAGLVVAGMFIMTMLCALFYLVRIGALDWIPERSKRNTRKMADKSLPQDSSGAKA